MIDNIISNENKKISGRPKKNDIYIRERNDIIAKLNDILEINNDKNYFILYDLNNNIYKQQQILALKDDIKKYFICSKWAFFNSSTHDKIKKDYLSLIRSVYKYMNYQITYKTKKIKLNDEIISTCIYYISRISL
jgi:hypothetical protein